MIKMKKTWNTPGIMDMKISGTQMFATEGTNVDGQYVSVDGKYSWYTYSGAYDHIHEDGTKCNDSNCSLK